jgi:hypothetical protein
MNGRLVLFHLRVNGVENGRLAGTLLNLVHLSPITVLISGGRILLGRKVKSSMMIRCPNCERIGKLPIHLGSAPRAVRCRRCRTRFTAVPPPAKEGIALTPRLFEASPIAERIGSIARFTSETQAATIDEPDDSSPQGVDPDDSQYELPVSVIVDIDDSQVELPAFTPDDKWPVAGGDPPSLELSPSSPWHYRFVDSWGRYHFAIAIGFGAFSLVILGFFLARTILGGQTISASVTLLIVGCVGMVAFLLLSVTVTALNMLLADLTKNVRQLRIQSEPKTRIFGE